MIQSLKKAASMLEFMKISNKEFTIAEISEAISIPPSTTHRILNTLIECDLVSKDERTHLYKLGPGLISLGMAATANINLQNEASPILRELSDKTNEDAFLIIRSGNSGVVVGKAEGPHTLKIVENFGREIALHKGAIRKVILANQTDEFIDNYLKTALEPYLEDEPLNPEKLKEQIEEIRRNHYSISMSEYIQNSMGVGAPVYNFKGEFVASIGLVAPLYRAESQKVHLVDSVRAAAIMLSRKLGYL